MTIGRTQELAAEDGSIHEIMEPEVDAIPEVNNTHENSRVLHAEPELQIARALVASGRAWLLVDSWATCLAIEGMSIELSVIICMYSVRVLTDTS